MGRVHDGGVRRDRLVLEHVDAGAPELACAKGGSHGVVVDDRAARGVHHDGVVFHELDVVGVQQMMGCRHERRVEADHVGGLQQLLEGRVGEVLRREALRDSLVIPHHDVEPEPARLARHRTADIAVAHDAEGAPVHLAQGTATMEVPDAGAHVGIDLVDAPQTRERKRYGVIAHHFRAVAGHVAHGASATSMLSTPVPVLLTTFSWGSAANTSAVKRP